MQMVNKNTCMYVCMVVSSAREYVCVRMSCVCTPKHARARTHTHTQKHAYGLTKSTKTFLLLK